MQRIRSSSVSLVVEVAGQYFDLGTLPNKVKEEALADYNQIDELEFAQQASSEEAFTVKYKNARVDLFDFDNPDGGLFINKKTGKAIYDPGYFQPHSRFQVWAGYDSVEPVSPMLLETSDFVEAVAEARRVGENSIFKTASGEVLYRLGRDWHREQDADSRPAYRDMDGRPVDDFGEELPGKFVSASAVPWKKSTSAITSSSAQSYVVEWPWDGWNSYHDLKNVPPKIRDSIIRKIMAAHEADVAWRPGDSPLGNMQLTPEEEQYRESTKLQIPEHIVDEDHGTFVNRKTDAVVYQDGEYGDHLWTRFNVHSDGDDPTPVATLTDFEEALKLTERLGKGGADEVPTDVSGKFRLDSATPSQGKSHTFMTSEGYTLYYVDGRWVDNPDPDEADKGFDDQDHHPVDSDGKPLSGKFF